jgi:ABC-2 type transport system ATP-binding protein
MTPSLLLALEALRLFGAGFFYFAHAALAALGALGALQASLALALNPRFLLLDESTLGLDPVSRKELEAILLDLKGEVLREGPTRALLREWAGEGYRLRLAEPKAEALAGALGPGWLPEAPDRLFFLGPWEALWAYLPRLDGEVLEISRGTPSLESLFLRLFGPAPKLSGDQ